MKYLTNILGSTVRDSTIKSIAIFSFVLFITGCDPTKKLAPHQFIVDEVKVENVKGTELSADNFEAFYRQKPNRKLFRKFHFFVWWYNLFDENKIREKKAKRNLKYDKKNVRKLKRYDRRNARRERKGKTALAPRLKDKEDPILIESIRDIGEPAVIYDSTLTEQTRQQLSRYLFTKGFFNNDVSDTVTFKRDKQRAIVKYYLFPGEPYNISNITYDLPDPQLANLFMSDLGNSLIKRGMRYDRDVLQNERQRLTELALNNGYFYFESAYIDYTADTSFANKTVDITMRLKMYQPPGNQGDSLVLTNHPRFKLKNVYIITEPITGEVQNTYFKDTVVSSRKKLKFLLNEPLSYRRKIISINTDLYPGQYYRKDTATQTYKALLGLGIFRNVTIRFFINESQDNMLDCYIVCNPLIKQSLTAETEGTNTGGNYGIDGSVVYQNRNLFKGGELVELRLQAAVIAQQNLNARDTAVVGGTDAANNLQRVQSTFNTIQFGPELRFSVPRAFFPFSLLPFRKDNQPRTYVRTSLNYQTRSDFSRIISSVDYGFTFKTYNRQLRHDIIPFEIYLIRAQLQPGFREELLAYKDAFLLNSFQDHITTLTKYAITFTSKESSITGKRTAYYAKLNLQSSGNLLRAYFKATGRPTDSLGRYHLFFDIPFAQFLKSDIDFRIYVPVRKKSRVVYRIAGGIGKPLANLNVLPYEQSFFSGGPNSVRAWRARTLGPGAYDPAANQTRFDKIGDILLEGNFEYRFHILRSFYGALFVDAGNIWRLKPDPEKPGGEFRLGTFADEIAIGGGFGIRWDLTFFVLRLDLAMPLKDPKLPAGKRWVLDQRPYEYTVANFGIGYPF